MKNKIRLVSTCEWRAYLFSNVLVFAVMLLFNFLTPYLADDWFYSLSKSIPDIFRKEYTHYFNQNGRSVAHIIARFFLMYNKIIFNIANSIIYILFTNLIFVHAVYGKNLKKREGLLCWIMVHLLLFIYVVKWGQIFLWLDGSCNYLWTSTIILLYLLPFRVYYSSPKEINKKYIFPLMCFGGLLTGWCNENTSGGAILFSILFLAVFVVQKIKLQKWMFGGLLCSIVTYIFMILSPGNAKRRASFGDTRAWYNQLISNFRNVTNNMYSAYKYLLFAIVIVTVIAICIHISQKYLILYGIYLLTAVAIFYALILSPVTSDRPLFGGSVFLVIACLSIFSCVIVKRTELLWGTIAYTSVLGIIFAVNFVNAGIDIAYFKVHSDRRDVYTIARKEEGYENIVVNEIFPKPGTKYNPSHGFDLSNDPNEWPSACYARHYNLNTVTAVSNDIFEKVFREGDFDLINCRDIYEYLELIKNRKYTVFMATNGDSSDTINDEILAEMSTLGLNTDLSQCFCQGYIAVIHKGNVLHEEHGSELLYYSDTIDNNLIEIMSSGKIHNKENVASIKVNEYEYALNTLGLNIVVYDNSKKKVVDRVTFNIQEGGGLGVKR